jgi:hypothetical protein
MYTELNEILNLKNLIVYKYSSGNQKWTIQRNWQHDEEKQNKNTTQYVLDTTMRKHTQIC